MCVYMCIYINTLTDLALPKHIRHGSQGQLTRASVAEGVLQIDLRVHVCVCERERTRERKRKKERESDVPVWQRGFSRLT